MLILKYGGIFVVVKIDRQEFEKLDLKELGWKCMSPIIQPLRGKSPSEKTQVYSKLTGSQQVLFMFYAFYNHAKNSISEFYWWSAYYVAQPIIWSEITTKLRNFQNGKLLGILEETETILRERSHPRSLDAFDVSPNDLENDRSLLSSFNPLYRNFLEITPFTLEEIGLTIRNNIYEFVQFED